MGCIKECKYNCGMKIFWDDAIEFKIKWREVDSGKPHDYIRCGNLLKEQGKELVKKK